MNHEQEKTVPVSPETAQFGGESPVLVLKIERKA